MQTLTVNDEIKISNGYSNSDTIFTGNVESIFYWGKCSINDETKQVQFMQGPGTCKDYVVDTYYRTYSHSYQSNLWSEDQIKYPSVYIWSGESFTKQYIQRIKEVLNPWEEANGFIPTEAFKVDFGDTKLTTPLAEKGVIVIKFDPIWMINSIAMSFFLSIVRHSLQTGVIQFKNSDTTTNTNEQEYYRRQSKSLKSVLDYSINNPRDYLDQIKDTTSTGYPTNPNSHGCTGLFYIMQTLFAKYSNRDDVKRTYIKMKQYEDHPNGKYIEYVLKKLKQEKEVPQDVKMQSLQPKVKRPRTRKATTTIEEARAAQLFWARTGVR